ncbi:MAG TPA: histidine triad nucleotide-binding protein [Coxiellaceae bacterium]|nr:MAG: histidine triad nucleotide-binding protein [Gammaproteobacteria bacterium RBG_16_37_9]HBC71401.1 histidine triad nucleotide-binding protein [Coxiellaceae bacterium]HBY56196.1 histidine triad nucleotide-binding protein [Coxiellaceae bacterium]
MSCIFCDIANGILPAKIIYQDKDIIAFDDIHPKAPHHKLIIPRKHIATLNDISIDDKDLIANMTLVSQKLAVDLNIAETGYRILINCNKDGGQVVYHLHLHLLGGCKLSFAQW